MRAGTRMKDRGSERRDGGMIERWGSEDLCSSFQLNCCGFTNYTDFVGSKFEKENRGNLPPSCCWTNSAPCRPGEAQRSNVQVRALGTSVGGPGISEEVSLVIFSSSLKAPDL